MSILVYFGSNKYDMYGMATAYNRIKFQMFNAFSHSLKICVVGGECNLLVGLGNGSVDKELAMQA